jgi:hypothetical protein
MSRVILLFLLLSSGTARAEQIVPAGTELQIRLKTTLSSYVSKAGTPIVAEVIAPVELNGQVVLPMRTELFGSVREARRVGLGLSRERALLDLEFNQMRVPGGELQDFSGLVTQVDNARERVDAKGRIRGIRATDSSSSVIAGAAISVSAFDPMALIFSLSSSMNVFRIPDSSVVLPAGTELHFKVGEELKVPGVMGPAYPALFAAGKVPAELDEVVKGLPFRTATKGSNLPSDLTSLMYLGSQEAIERAFLAAGWVRSDELNGKSSYGVMKSIVENQGYQAAPMSVLTLAGKEPELAFAKTLNTFFTRHHLRIYSQQARVDGQPVWTSTATYDSGIGFSKGAKTFIHLINENIDEERSKVVHDLLLTGCVEGVGFQDRPWVPRDAKNATGDTLRTDGKIAILRMNDCVNPLRADEEDVRRENLKLRQSAYLRPLRTTLLTLRNDLTRGNVVYQAYSGIRVLWSLKGPAVSGDSQKSIRYGGQEFLVVDGAKPMQRDDIPKDGGEKLKLSKEAKKPKSYANQLLFSLNGGLNGFGNELFSTQRFALAVSAGGQTLRVPLQFDTVLERGWAISPKLTVNTWKYVSNEFSYTRTSTNFRLFGQDELLGNQLDSRSKAAIRNFSYSTLVHLTPNGRRIRPYFAVGPTLQLIHLLEAKPAKNSLLSFAARDVALLVTAYNFGSKPALDGGGVFQFGLNYGGGVRIHVTPRLFLRADYRETVSRQPDFWKSIPQRLQQGITEPNQRLEVSPLQRHGLLRQQLVTMGIGISF